MAIFKDFGENGDLVGTRNEPLNEGNLKKYIEENGIEKVEGYLQALEDITKSLNNILYIQLTNGYTMNSSYKVRKLTDQFELERLSFLHFAKNILKIE